MDTGIVMKLEARNLTLGYGGTPVVRDLDLVVPEGAITAVVGSNACGKSTLLRGLARLLRPMAGAVHLDGRSIFEMPTRTVARHLAILPQRPLAPGGLTVRDLVAQGRYPYQGLLRQWSGEDEGAVAHALATTGLEELADRPMETLSGGQAQRAWIAMILAQETPILLLDEPTTFLDLAHQIEILDLLGDLNRERGRTVLMVLHDLNQACRYAQSLVVMTDGRVVARGRPETLVTADLVQEVFGLACRVVEDPVTGRPLCVPLDRRAAAGAGVGASGSARRGSMDPEPAHGRSGRQSP